MKLRLLTRDELARAYAQDLRAAFPPSELKSLRAMLGMLERGIYDPLCLEDEQGEKLGYILLWKHRDGRYFLIDYFCVPASRRGGGIGGRILQMVRDRYPADTVFLAESEAPSGDPERDGLICRRLGFYARNGAHTLGYDCALFGVRFKVLCWAEPLPEEAEILQKHREIYLDQFGPEQYRRCIQLPLGPGEAPFPVTDWVEEGDL